MGRPYAESSRGGVPLPPVCRVSVWHSDWVSQAGAVLLEPGSTEPLGGDPSSHTPADAAHENQTTRRCRAFCAGAGDHARVGTVNVQKGAKEGWCRH
eukprot:6211089-Pleurochrysis_carterae.AAC.2